MYRYKLILQLFILVATSKKDSGVVEGEERNSEREKRAPQQPSAGLAITNPPRDVTVPLGGSFYLECGSNLGSEEVRIKWVKETERLRVDEHIEISSNGQLFVDRVRKEDAGRYTCKVASRDLGSRGVPIEASAHVYVQYQPEFTLRPGDQAIREGSQARLQCDAPAYPPAVFSWLRNGNSLRLNRRVEIRSTRYSSVLTVGQLSDEDTGTYTCVAQNPLGRIETSAIIRIRNSVTPRITVRPKDVEARVGEAVYFGCQATGDPEPRIVWRFNGSPIPTVRGHYHVAADNTLRISSISLNDVGHYSCQAGNTVGSVMADAVLRVFDGAPRPGRPLPRDPPPTRRPPRPATRQPSRGPRPGSNPPTRVPIRPRTDAPPLRPADSDLIRQSVDQARINVNRAINDTRKDLLDERRKSPHELLALFRFPRVQAVELARAREIYEETLKIIQDKVETGLQLDMRKNEGNKSAAFESTLSISHLQMIMELSGCTPYQPLVDACSDMCFHQKYRSYDGQCNNLNHPMWGAALTPLHRLLSPIYENGFNTPVGWNPHKLYHGFRKPNPREVSLKVISTREVSPDPDMSAMFMQWGQFLDHDIDLSVPATSRVIFETGAVCNQTCMNVAPCFNIGLPINDPRRDRPGQTCIEFERSSAVCGSGETSLIFQKVAQREQINGISSFIDASQVYGNSEQEALDLRDLFSDHGFLRFDIVSHSQKAYLPFNRDSPIDCRRSPNQDHPFRCFLAGDPRANEQLGLLSMHTLWLREHNRLAGELLAINPHWDGERIYQEARKLIGAQLQHFTFQHWLPKVLGPHRYRSLSPYSGYNSTTTPAVSNVFATAAFRFGHAFVNPTLFRLNSSWETVPQGHLPLHEAFFAPERLLSEGGIDPILRGLFGSPAKRNDPSQLLNIELTEKLFGQAHDIALDLAALNIQRGRDHGLPSYLEFRKFCGLSTAESFADLEDIENDEVKQKLKRLYGHPGNLDVWIGGLIEKAVPGGKVGPTFGCIISEQFRRLRDGDRFWYEAAGVFTPLQLEEIKKASLARVLCDNGDGIDRVSPDVFTYAGPRMEDYASCLDIPRINLNIWQECCSDSCAAGGSGNIYPEDEASPLRFKRSNNMYEAPRESIESLTKKFSEMNEKVEGFIRETEKLNERIRDLESVRND